MNRLTIVVLFVGAFVAVVAANRGNFHGGEFDEEADFDIGFHGGDRERFGFNDHGSGSGMHEFTSSGNRHPHPYYKRGPIKQHYRPFHRKRHNFRGRPRFAHGPAIVGGGAGIRGAELNSVGLRDRQRLANSFGAEGHEASLIGNQNRLDLDHSDGDFHDTGALRKHQGINQSKTIVSESNKGFNDVDSFHNTNAHNDHDHLSNTNTQVAAQEAGGKIGLRNEADRDFAVGGTQASELEAGAVGAGII